QRPRRPRSVSERDAHHRQTPSFPTRRSSDLVELIKDDKGQVAGAVLLNMETDEYLVARAKTVIIATGGAGRLHYNNFPTSNHYRSEEHTSELQSRFDLVCRLLLEKKKECKTY